MPGPKRSFPALDGAAVPASFLDYLSANNPDLLPFGRTLPSGAMPETPHGTTIVALEFADGVIMAGDRRATMGSMIASRRIEKVFPADHFSVLGIAGTAGIALDMVRLFQVELEHFEKIEGTLLSLDGKANRLGAMVRANLSMALQGLSVVPVFAGVEPGRPGGRLFSYDVTGGRYEEREHHSVGSGSVFARGALKKLWRPGMSASQALAVAVTALYDASDDDSATGGPDPIRRVWPSVWQVTQEGTRRIPGQEIAAVVQELLTQRAVEGGES